VRGICCKFAFGRCEDIAGLRSQKFVGYKNKNKKGEKIIDALILAYVTYWCVGQTSITELYEQMKTN